MPASRRHAQLMFGVISGITLNVIHRKRIIYQASPCVALSVGSLLEPLDGLP